MLQAGEITQAKIARELGVTEATVSRWKKKLDQGGVQALQARTTSGKPPKLDQAAKHALVEKLEAEAIAAGFPTEQWTQARVKQVIEREFGVSYHRNYISRLLHDLSWSGQKPDPRAIARDEELVRDWLKQDFPRIKKRGGSA